MCLFHCYKKWVCKFKVVIHSYTFGSLIVLAVHKKGKKKLQWNLVLVCNVHVCAFFGFGLFALIGSHLKFTNPLLITVEQGQIFFKKNLFAVDGQEFHILYHNRKVKITKNSY